MNKIKKIKYNFVQTSDGETLGEDYDVAEVGVEIIYKPGNKVKSIIQGEESDKTLFYYITMEDNSGIKIYNPNTVYYSN